jgi:hypothetical protein
MQERMAEIGLELLNQEELDELRLEHSTNMFSASYEMAERVGLKIPPMTPAIKHYSFLNRWFIFRRRSVPTFAPAYIAALPAAPAALPAAPVAIAEEPTEQIDIEFEEPNTLANFREDLEQDLMEEDGRQEQATLIAENLSAADEREDQQIAELVAAEALQPPPMPEQETIEEVEEIPDLVAEMDAASSTALPAAPAAAAVPTASEKATGPVYKFYQKGETKDDLKIGDRSWRRWLSTYALSPLKDLDDPTVIYPSMEAAFAAAKFKYASNKPELGATLFRAEGDIHQKYERTRAEKGQINEKEDLSLMEDEGDEVRKTTKPTEMKKLGAKFNETMWREALPRVLEGYVAQRYANDARFRGILEAIKTRKGHLMFFTAGNPTELSGKLSDADEIEGENLLGRSMMKQIGLYY